MRLDALCCNTPAHRLYEALGFVKRDARNWYTRNAGEIDFFLYELGLDGSVFCTRNVKRLSHENTAAASVRQRFYFHQPPK